MSARPAANVRRRAWVSDLWVFALVLVAFLVSAKLADGTLEAVLVVLIVLVGGLAVRFGREYRRRRRSRAAA